MVVVRWGCGGVVGRSRPSLGFSFSQAEQYRGAGQLLDWWSDQWLISWYVLYLPLSILHWMIAFSTSYGLGLATQTDWIDVKTVFIFIIFKIYGSYKLNSLSFDHNPLIKNSILFCKSLCLLKLHRNSQNLHMDISFQEKKTNNLKSDT